MGSRSYDLVQFHHNLNPAQFDILPCLECILNFSADTTSLFSKTQRQKQPPPPSAPPPNATSKILKVIKSLPVAFGGGRVGVVLFFQRKLYNAYHPVDILHYIIIPKANYLITQRLKILCSFRVILSLI
jgi:hypothetical protein